MSYHLRHRGENKMVHYSDTAQQRDTDSEIQTGRSPLHSAKVQALHNQLLQKNKTVTYQYFSEKRQMGSDSLHLFAMVVLSKVTYCGIQAEGGATVHCFGTWRRNSQSPGPPDTHTKEKHKQHFNTVLHYTQEPIKKCPLLMLHLAHCNGGKKSLI